MKQFHEQLKNSAENVRLTEAEKRELRERVVSYMEYHPLPEHMNAQTAMPRPSRVAALTHAAGLFAQNFYARRAFGAVAVVVLILVPFVAERAVPGDVLYPVKVRFNEEVKSTLAFSPYEQVEWETERLERRLAEARVLASEGRLTPEMEAQVAEAVRQHSDAAQVGIASIRESDSDEAAIAEITFSSALDVQSEMLEGRSEALSTAVDSARQVAQESQQSNKPSYEKLLARIEQESTSAYELFDTITPQASAIERRDIERRLENIRRTVDEAATIHETNRDEAVAMLSTALADTRKAISFMTDFDVRTNVTIDELLPDEMTDEERIAHINARLVEVAEIEADVAERLTTVDSNTLIAIEARLAEMTADVETASSSLAEDDLDAADVASLSALTTAHDLIIVLDQYSEELGESTATSTGATSTESTSGAATTTDGSETRSTSTTQGSEGSDHM